MDNRSTVSPEPALEPVRRGRSQTKVWSAGLRYPHVNYYDRAGKGQGDGRRGNGPTRCGFIRPWIFNLHKGKGMQSEITECRTAGKAGMSLRCVLSVTAAWQIPFVVSCCRHSFLL